MTRLAGAHRLIAPDLRGFGDSSKPGGPWGAAEHAADMLALLDALGVGRVGVVGHDVGGAVMQAMARAAPDRFAGLFFFDFVYPGIGARMGTPDRLNEIWYQSFHQMDFAPALLGSSREACRIYFEAHPPPLVPPQGRVRRRARRLRGQFPRSPATWPAASPTTAPRMPGRMAMIAGTAPALPPIDIPTCVRWAEHDPLFPYAWTDRLGETFTNLDLDCFRGVGHFPHREDPERAAAEIAAFFARHTPTN